MDDHFSDAPNIRAFLGSRIPATRKQNQQRVVSTDSAEVDIISDETLIPLIPLLFF